MISAQFAREISKRAKESNINVIIENLEKVIKTAAHEGKTNICHGGYLPDEVINVLIECGYTIIKSDRKDGMYIYNKSDSDFVYAISW